MLNSMIIAREKVDGCYNITLRVPEGEYFKIYEDLDKNAAEDIIKQYITYHGDDGRYSDAKIEHDKNKHTVNIYAKLHYEDNDHTEEFVIPSHLTDRT